MIYGIYYRLSVWMLTSLGWLEFVAYDLPKWSKIKARLTEFFQPLIAISQLWFALSILVGIVFLVMLIFMILPRK